jgi:PRTRC genetic system ThiF family protein
MHTLTFDPPLPYLLPADAPVAICLVGCGGTGSHLAQSLARLVVHCRDSGRPPVELVFVDGDAVEARNIGRQLFCSAELGHNKAQTLAARFGAALGLRITAIPKMATASLLREVAPRQTGAIPILVGAVDGATGRLAMAQALGSAWRLWVDAGNHERQGQVVVGTTMHGAQLRGALRLGLCTALPAAPLLYPELLHEPEAAAAPVDCAQAMTNEAQSLMVNQAMAAVAAQYLYDLVVRRRLTTFATTISLEPLAMRSQPITARQLSQATGIDAAVLQDAAQEREVAA